MDNNLYMVKELALDDSPYAVTTDIASNFISSGLRFTQQPTDRYEIDFDKIRTLHDCVTLLQAVICGITQSKTPKVYVQDDSAFYDRLRHLAKEEE